ncbi:NAD(+) synthase [Komagataeibacter rhaeticus]|uniref:Glutamine-dependent NAD(+) synthetase n=1 Tax=Komagataeibacter rhaeticus TaxID=215221 RepID=A0A181C768_9PROT|nr:NAD(+) synthase [Komagataeibacter rhaeticus]ATU73719.1 NAD(+) synthase [Komagataeibacter xylinus]QIP34378.1 NAD(+) synthase [Komagataeibacter rhaeticus]QOC46890.1 NAD(+) synthase [Komagataeibacter rhaeticus]WPP20713.1 NAD(+) synthase [Komagataeibacter rhaeticus]SAY47407.1 Glutamine-dependent NAD() synthetase [Komagataeibacter rhaeticus]
MTAGSGMAGFHGLYQQGFARVAACTLPVALADPMENARRIHEGIVACHQAGAVLAVFPELGLSGYAIEDLRQQDVLLDQVMEAAAWLARQTAGLLPLVLVGAPVVWEGALYNCAIALHDGHIVGVIPKSYLPNYREFYEARQFTAGAGLRGGHIMLGARAVPFGTDLLFRARGVRGLVIAAELCEDMWVPQPPAVHAALAGATVIANLSASNITVGKARTRTLLCQSHSARCLCAYVYAAAGEGESTTDVAWDGQASIFENGVTLAQSARFPTGLVTLLADVDLDLLRQERLRMGTFADNRAHVAAAAEWRSVELVLSPPSTDLGLKRAIPRFPFVPSDPALLDQDCYEAFTIQVTALKRRVLASRAKTLVIGVSGGLDSTHALLVAARAADECGLGRQAVLGYTMPGFGTSGGTRDNAHELMAALGVQAHEIDIRPAARLMLEQMGHPFAGGEAVYDVTFENVQAGLRTDFLFRLANQSGGIVIGTGDLSELALGWCTYGVGDQMAHYNVNAGLPKTLIQHLIRWVMAHGRETARTCTVLDAILATEISPELVPATAGQAVQSTESLIGPYALHDFTLFHVLRYGFRPSKIAFMALHAWGDAARGDWPPGFPEGGRKVYALSEIRHWLGVFLNRFFGFSQFKRSAMPNGPKVLAGGALSPRGDWRAPSDGNARIWVEELESRVPTD